MRFVLRVPAPQLPATALAVAVTLLISGCHGSRREPTPLARSHKGGAVANCSARSEADFPGAFANRHNVVVGPLVLVGGAERTPASVARRFGGQKFPLLVMTGHTVTVTVPRQARRFERLAYWPLPEGPVRFNDAHRTIKIVSCRRGEPTGSSADGAVTFWSGRVLTRMPACVPLDIYVDDQASPRRVALSVGAACRGAQASRG